MNWKKVLPWSKPTSGTASPYRSFDHKLLQNTQDRLLPKWSQLKYISRFLTKRENIVIRTAALIAALSCVGLIGLFLHHHIAVLPKEGGEYTEAMIGQPKYINPLFSSTNDVDADLSNLIYSGLFKYNEKQKLVPDLAESYIISEDKKIYEVKLRSDARWSDGEPFTVNDVLFTFDLIQNPEIGSPLFATFQGVKIERTGDNSVRFILSEPFAPFIQSLTNGILPEHIWSGINPTTIRLAKNNIQPIGTGPWQFSKLLKDESGTVQSYTLTRNENYYGQRPYLKTLTFKFFYDPVHATEQALEALKSRGVDGISFANIEQTKKINQRSFPTYELHLPQYTALFFNNTQAPVLKEVEVRKALTQAIEKNKLVEDIFGTGAAAIDNPLNKENIQNTSSTSSLDFSLENANTLLDKKWTRIKPEEYYNLRYNTLLKEYGEKWKNENGDASSTITMSEDEKKNAEKIVADSVRQEMNIDQTFYRRDKNNNVLLLTITTVNTPEYRNVADWIAKAWEKIGIKTFIRTIDNRQITRDALRNRSYDILLYGEIMSLDPDPFPFWHSSQTEYPGLNLANFADRNADKLLEDARATIDPVKRAEFYNKFYDILKKEIPAIFLYAPTHYFIVSKDIKGISPSMYLNTPSDRFNDLPNWYVKTKWKWK